MKQLKDAIGLLLFVVVLSCSSKDSLTTEAIEKELELTNKTEVEVMEEIRSELLLRKMSEPNLPQGETIYIADSILVQNDSGFVWKVTRRPLRSNDELSMYPTDSLVKLYSQKLIYGNDDNRFDLTDLEDNSPLKKTSQQIACFIRKSNLVKREDGTFKIKARLFSEAKYLCGTERFFNQPVPGFCSGFAVSENQIITAGHCASVDNLNDFLIVFGFAVISKDSVTTVFSPKDVYRPLTILSKGPDNEGNDYAVVTVDHPIPLSRIAAIRNTQVSLHEPVFVIGHPCGLPLKIANGARVTFNDAAKYFNADLDTYGGNSGSAVYDSLHQVVGILVRGARDFNFNFQDGCYYSNICLRVGLPGCEGESVSRNIQFAHQVNR